MRYLAADIREMRFKGNGLLIGKLNLEVAQGEIVSLVAASGAGKTTLLRILAGLETRFKGQVAFDSKSVTRPSRRIQIVFQDNRLFPWLNSHHNIAFATKIMNRKTRAEHVRKLLSDVGLADRAKALPKDLSGGEESRVAFARVFIDPPDLLLLDEPFRALDAVTKDDLHVKLLGFIGDKKTTVILVSHSIDDAVLISDRVIVLSRNPLCVHSIFKIDKPRPRVRGDVDLVSVSTQVFEALKKTT